MMMMMMIEGKGREMREREDRKSRENLVSDHIWGKLIPTL